MGSNALGLWGRRLLPPESAAEAFDRSAEDSARSAGGLLFRSDPPMARDFGSSAGLEGRMGSLLEEQTVGGLFAGSVDSPIGPIAFRLSLLVVVAHRRRYWC